MLTSHPPESGPNTIRRVDDLHQRRTGFGIDRPAARLTQRSAESTAAAQELESCGAGLVRHVPPSDMYSVTVVTGDVGEAVRAAGGWICDRVRAGWRVSALVPEGCDTTPLRILGVETSALPVELDRSWLTPKPATLAIGTEVLSLPIQISGQVRAMMTDRVVEVTVWGDGDIDAGQHFHEVHHRLSPAAKCFKQHAMRAASLSDAATTTEFLRSCAPWYPLDQEVDLNTVAAGGGGSMSAH